MNTSIRNLIKTETNKILSNNNVNTFDMEWNKQIKYNELFESICHKHFLPNFTISEMFSIMAEEVGLSKKILLEQNKCVQFVTDYLGTFSKSKSSQKRFDSIIRNLNWNKISLLRKRNVACWGIDTKGNIFLMLGDNKVYAHKATQEDWVRWYNITNPKSKETVKSDDILKLELNDLRKKIVAAKARINIYENRIEEIKSLISSEPSTSTVNILVRPRSRAKAH